MLAALSACFSQKCEGKFILLRSRTHLEEIDDVGVTLPWQLALEWLQNIGLGQRDAIEKLVGLEYIHMPWDEFTCCGKRSFMKTRLLLTLSHQEKSPFQFQIVIFFFKFFSHPCLNFSPQFLQSVMRSHFFILEMTFRNTQLPPVKIRPKWTT